VADGYVCQLRTGVRIAVGSGLDFDPLFELPGERFFAMAQTDGVSFVGGSGRNLVSTGLTPALSGPAVPVGLWVPGRPDQWHLGIFTLTKTGASAANIHDGTDTVASQTAGSAPVGNYAATAYGKTTYNGGADFTIAAAAEEGAPGGLPGLVCSVSAGTAQTGDYTPTTAAAAASDDDADWTLAVNTDGTADLLYDGTIMATRAEGSPLDFAGIYEATAAGIAAFNSGAAWRAFIGVTARAPRAGFVYLAVTESAGVLSAVSGPHFATALPADTLTVFHAPLAQSDGSGGLVQIHTGLLAWPGGILQTRHLQFPAVLRGNPSTQPTADGVGSASGLRFSNVGSKYAYFQWEIPEDWTGGDITVEVDWCPFSGAMGVGDAVKWIVSYGSRAVGEAINGLLTSVPSTTAGAIGQYVTTHTPHTLAAADATNPLAHEDHLFVRVERDNTVAGNWAGDALVTAFEVLYQSNASPEG
jgi:hypothetical protein